MTVLYDYWRSSAAYRVRIALHLKNISFRSVSVDLLKQENLDEEHRRRHAQGLVPALEIDGEMLTQSLAIIRYLDQTRPEPMLIPRDPLEQAHAMALAYAIAMETHVVSNMSVAVYAAEMARTGDDGKSQWIRHFIAKGLRNFEASLAKRAQTSFCMGEQPGIVDICLVPQLYNAERWDVDITSLPRSVEITEHCRMLSAFQAAEPEAVNC